MTELRKSLELPPARTHQAGDRPQRLSRHAPDSTGDPEDAGPARQRRGTRSRRPSSSPTRTPTSTLGDFLEQITLASDVDGWDEQQDRVSVMTLHSAKGLEFPVVYVMAVEEGILPHERSLHDGKGEEKEEERRLLFVGMTRAMKELYLTHARLRDFRGQTLYAIPSGFLNELPEEVVEHQAQSRHAGRTPSHDFYPRRQRRKPNRPGKKRASQHAAGRWFGKDDSREASILVTARSSSTTATASARSPTSTDLGRCGRSRFASPSTAKRPLSPTR